MTDNQLWSIIIPIIQTGLIAQGYNNVFIDQSNQPTKQGTNSAPTVYIYKLFDHRYGFLERTDYIDPLSGNLMHKESQQYETTFQTTILVKQDPQNSTLPTASDLASVTAGILQSDSTLQTLAENDALILRVMDIRNPYFTDDYDQFEAAVSFDFTLTYTRDIITPQVSINETQVGLYPI